MSKFLDLAIAPCLLKWNRMHKTNKGHDGINMRTPATDLLIFLITW